MSSMIKNVAIYCRISEDDSGQEEGVQRQLASAEDYAAQHGYTIVERFEDNDISALKGLVRSGYEGLLSLVSTGAIDAVIVFHTSRLWRNRRERADGIDHFGRHRVSIIPTKGTMLDLTSAQGRGMAGLLGEFDTMESELKSERVMAAAADRAGKGRPNGSVPYGWKRRYAFVNDERHFVRDELHPEEAPIVAQILDRLLNQGHTLIQVTKWLNDEGIPAPGRDFKLRHRTRGLLNPEGDKWGKTSVKKIALRATNCGHRLYHAGRPDEKLMEMKADPIIMPSGEPFTVADWNRLCAKLRNPKNSMKKGGARRHLLSYTSFASCGVCQGPLRASRVKRTTKAGGEVVHELYICLSREGCVGRSQEWVDKTVLVAAAVRLAEADAVEVFTRKDDSAALAVKLQLDLEERLKDATSLFAAGDIDKSMLRDITAELRPKIEKARRAAQVETPHLPSDLLHQIEGMSVEAIYTHLTKLTVVQQLAILTILFDSVELLKRTKRGPGFEPETVRINRHESTR